MSGLDEARVLVIGLGASGIAAAEALGRLDLAGLTVVDTRHTPEVAERAAELRSQGLDARAGVTTTDVLGASDLVVASPGVAPSNPLLAAAIAGNQRVWSEPELAWRLNAGRTRLIAVTGTNGKTTTTELLAACLHSPVGGNIGTPLTTLLAASQAPEVVVAELSSFQLRFTEQLRCTVGLLLNVAADHLDWHGGLADYARAKARVWANQQPVGGHGLHGRDWAVVGVDDPGARATLTAHPAPAGVAGATTHPPAAGQVGVVDGTLVSRVDGEVEIAEVDVLDAPGAHNLANAVAAVAGAICAGADPGGLAGPLAGFRPGPHRLEQVARIDGVTYVDDSKATNPHAAAAALASFGVPGAPSIVWIAGGLNKGLEFADLTTAVRDRVRAAVTIGRSGPEIAALTRGLEIPTVEAGTLAEAVPVAAGLAEPGDTVLLAPACASMDQFADYAARGRAFRDAVAAVAGRRPAKEQARGQ